MNVYWRLRTLNDSHSRAQFDYLDLFKKFCIRFFLQTWSCPVPFPFSPVTSFQNISPWLSLTCKCFLVFNWCVLQTRENAMYQEGREAVTISEWTDRIYQNTAQEHIITNVVSGRKMRIQKYNFPDTGEHGRGKSGNFNLVQGVHANSTQDV